MAGYSGTPLAKKLGIEPGSTILLDGVPPFERGESAVSAWRSANPAERQPPTADRRLGLLAEKSIESADRYH